jgi:uncharacterized protein YbaR (Trm112 family)
LPGAPSPAPNGPLCPILLKWPQAISAKRKKLDTRLLEILACPICKGTLKFQRDAQVLVCRMDRLAYPIRDDVPVMLEEEARQLSADDPLLDR